MKKLFDIVVATSGQSRIIGCKGDLPWKFIKKDINRFTSLTTGRAPNTVNAVIMGRKTYESLKSPLKDRMNIVITRNQNYFANSSNFLPHMTTSLDSALDLCNSNPKIDGIFVIGGGEIYTQAMAHELCRRIFLTQIPEERVIDLKSADVWLTSIPDKFQVIEEEFADDITFITYLNNRLSYNNRFFNFDSQELRYLACLERILTEGEIKGDRTGTGVISKFHEHLEFDIPTKEVNGITHYQIPMLTTKRISAKSVILELVWFLKGMTDSKWLSDRGVNIWKDNTSLEFLRSRGLNYDAGKLGPGYGFQWIHWGDEWSNEKTKYKGGVNQVQGIIDTLRKDPDSRRAVLSAWNVGELDKIALPPCHILYTFKIEREKLCCMVTLRSNDMFLGAPFNIMSASMLTVLIAKALGRETGKVACAISDAHIYSNHVSAVSQQLHRSPMNFPWLSINKGITCHSDMTELELSDFQINDYVCWPKIEGKMAV